MRRDQQDNQSLTRGGATISKINYYYSNFNTTTCIMAGLGAIRHDSSIAAEVLRRNLPHVIESYSNSFIRFADKLFARNFISDADWRKAKDNMSGHTIDQRIGDLVSIVRDSIRRDGSRFEAFTDIVRSEDTMSQHKLAEILDKEYDCKKKLCGTLILHHCVIIITDPIS